MEKYIIIVVCCAAVSLIFSLKKAHALKNLFSSALSGIAGLLVLNSFPAFSGMLTANLFSLGICAVFGLPGLMSLLLMRMICSV